MSAARAPQRGPARGGLSRRVALQSSARVTNPASNEPLLDALSKHLVASRFDLHTLVRDICTSRT